MRVDQRVGEARQQLLRIGLRPDPGDQFCESELLPGLTDAEGPVRDRVGLANPALGIDEVDADRQAVQDIGEHVDALAAQWLRRRPREARSRSHGLLHHDDAD